MTAESPVRIFGGRSRKWVASDKQHNGFVSSPSTSGDSLEAEPRMKENKYAGNSGGSVPCRCGSAPPSVGGSFQSIQNVLGQKSLNKFEGLESEDDFLANPAYFTYYMSNVNLNPRLPQPNISREDRHLVCNHIRPADGEESVALLDTHREENEDETLVRSRLPLEPAASIDARHKSLVDLIQEDFPRTPSPIYTTRPSSSSNHVLSDDAIDSDALLDQLHANDPAVVQRNKLSFPQSPSPSGRAMNSHSSSLKGQSTRASPRSDIVGSTISEVQSGIKNLSVEHLPSSRRRITVSRSASEGESLSQHRPGPIEAPVFQTSGMYSPSAYTPAVQSSSMLYPQNNISGYALSPSMMPAFMPGYAPHGGFPVAYDNSGIPNMGGVDLQQLYKFYGQAVPTFADPLLYVHYSQQPQYDPFASRSQFQSYNESKCSVSNASVGISSPRFGGTVGPNYFGSPQGLGFMMMCGSPPIGSPVIPGSPSGSTMLRSGTNERVLRTSDSRSFSFLDELKSNKARRFELADILGHIVEFSADQHGSRFIQQKLESCSANEKATVFEELLPHATSLMTDVFGNYVIQKFFEHGNAEQRRKLGNKLASHILTFSLQMYGCRVIQKALEVLEIDQKVELVQELDGHVLECVHDQNGNHVIQKCIECVPMGKIGFIISSFYTQVAALSVHAYGCRVIQRVLEHSSDEVQTQSIIDEILLDICTLAQDQYGNYVTQHVLERGKPHERSLIIRKLAGQIVQMSQNKYASNVIEKCLEYGGDSDKEVLIQEILGQSEGNDNLLVMMKDQFANYVVQKILETSSEKQREALLRQIQVHLPALKKYTYGKHIVARVEQLCSELDTSDDS